MLQEMMDGFEVVVRTAIVTLVVSVPLGLWKLIEIVVWLFNHVSVSAT